jgi:hypothetical protein
MEYRVIYHRSGQLRRIERPKDTRAGQVSLAKTTSATVVLRIELLEIESVMTDWQWYIGLD